MLSLVVVLLWSGVMGQHAVVRSLQFQEQKYPFENGNKFLVTPDGKGVSAPMMMLGFGGEANDKNCWKMNLLPFSKGYNN